MSLDPANPASPAKLRPVLETYDPNWKARFEAAEARLKVIRDRANPVRDHELTVQLNRELIDAHEAQYKHIGPYAAAHHGHHCLGARPDDPPQFYAPAPVDAVTPAQVDAHYAALGKARSYWRFLKSLPPSVEWDTGVFAQTPPAGVARKIEQDVIDRPLMWAPLRMTLVVEHHPGTTHVCVVQGPEDLAKAGTHHLNMVTNYIAERYLPRPGLPSRLWLWLRGEPTQRLMFHYTYTPTPNGPPPQPVWGYELRWAHSLGRTRVEREELKVQQATPLLRDLAMALAPEARAGKTLH